ncbi:hypothetical protein AA0473_0465 [Acetobacter orleanensis NRIC 0473]|nr:hypothetical protein AA0473_0465 [Acetobacter orleanensis NRIC 0473]
MNDRFSIEIKSGNNEQKRNGEFHFVSLEGFKPELENFYAIDLEVAQTMERMRMTPAFQNNSKCPMKNLIERKACENTRKIGQPVKQDYFQTEKWKNCQNKKRY